MKLISGLGHIVTISALLFATAPSSSSYQLRNYDYGSGGAGSSSSSNYSLNGTTGQVESNQSSSSYSSKSGNNNVQQANVPGAPTFTNPASYYNKLKFVINTSNNPSDTKYSIAISDDNFTTTKYIKSDNTIGTSKTISDYQTYTTWGGASGGLVIGLTPATTYKIKVSALQGKFTETQYGPTATAATVAPSITYDIDVSASDIETAPPYATSFGSLLPATVTDAAQKVWIDVDTNADSGAMVYVSSKNSGLKSTIASFTIASATANLTSATTGYGIQGSTATQSSGGPLTISSPYNVSAQNVGLIDTALRQVFSASAPITAGRGSFILKAKSTAQTPAATDYQDILTIIVAASY